ncbi:MAG: tRNA-dihydrouridine synthase family protein [Planctomycetota bacterium]
MGCETDSNNATGPSPGVAPALAATPPAQEIDPRAAAERQLVRFNGCAVDPRVTELMPGFDAPFFQAGLAGYSDAAMRIIARRHGCPMCVTEALLDRTLLAGGRGFAKADLGDIEENVPGGAEDHPLTGQIMGSEPAEMAAAAIKMIEQGKRKEKEYRRLAEGAPGTGHQAPALAVQTPSADSTPVPGARSPVPAFSAIDVNLACPVKKIQRKARGGHWLAAPEGATALLEAVREAVPKEIPVTVKLRRSFDDTPEMIENFYRVFDAAYDVGCAWVTVHGRTVTQKYVGPSRWDMIREIVQRKHPGKHTSRIVFGSGDIWAASEIVRMIDYCSSERAHLAGTSVARGCIGNPWIFRQARSYLAGREPKPPTIEEQRSVLEQHFELALAVNRSLRHPELHTGKTMRKFAIRFAAHHPRGDEVRKRFIAVNGLDEWRAVLDEWYTPELAAAKS